MYATKDLCWIDFEGKGAVDIKCGTRRYAASAKSFMLAYAVGDGDVKVWADWPRLDWRDAPQDLQRAYADGMMFAAWNASFDRAIWNNGLNFPPMNPGRIIDPMAQAVANGLPGKLNDAGVKLLNEGKQADAKKLIKLFCEPDSVGEPGLHWEEWQRLTSYASQDVALMRSIYEMTRKLSFREWGEFHAAEAINARGVAVDLDLCREATRLANDITLAMNADLSRLTEGRVSGVTKVKDITKWLLDPERALPEAGRKVITRVEEEVGEDEAIVEPAKHGLNRARIGALLRILELDDNPHVDYGRVIEVLRIREWGGATTPAKFAAISRAALDGILSHQIVFNGSSTGRYSSRGAQVHNLRRAGLGNELDVIDAVRDGADYHKFAILNPSQPAMKSLSMLVRPAIIARPDKVLVWSDWSAIEARVLPWLSASPAADEEVLASFRESDADPKKPDVYERNAMRMFGLDEATARDRSLDYRARSKVATLALGFAGATGALHNMGANYDMRFSDAEAAEIVRAWRSANPWAGVFWDKLWEAALMARDFPGEIFTAGRIRYMYDHTYRNGSLICELPSGRQLTYASFKKRKLPVKDPVTNEIIDYEYSMSYIRQYGVSKIWKGVLAENVTQAVAADILRGTLVRLENDRDSGLMPVVLHVHDEIVTEPAEEDAEFAANKLREFMCRGFDWSEGLPLNSEETIAYHYTKSKGSTWQR